LHDKKHGIALEDRPHILLAALCWRWGGVPSRLYNLLQNEVALKYPNFATYATAVYEDCESWALCYRVDLPLRGNNTNNFCEAQFLMKWWTDKKKWMLLGLLTN
jgi:hypothetical protein